jgi:hypothetical protein
LWDLSFPAVNKVQKNPGHGPHGAADIGLTATKYGTTAERLALLHPVFHSLHNPLGHTLPRMQLTQVPSEGNDGSTEVNEELSEVKEQSIEVDKAPGHVLEEPSQHDEAIGKIKSGAQHVDIVNIQLGAAGPQPVASPRSTAPESFLNANSQTKTLSRWSDRCWKEIPWR